LSISIGHRHRRWETRVAYIQGVSTRRVGELVQAPSLTGIDKSKVNRICQELDEQVAADLTSGWKAGKLAI